MTEGYEQTSTRRAPASAAQGRLWLLSQLEDERSAYNVLLPLRFVGDLDVPALRSALSGLVERHEILRTRYVAQDGEPVQVIEAPAPVELAETDLSTMDEDGQESALDAAFDDAETRPFDLGTGPVLRAALLRLAAHRHVLLLSVHHIAIDAGSTPVLYRDLAAGYRAHLAGTTDGLPPLAFQYADHAVRERAAMTGELTGRRLAYWRERLRDLPELDLPTDRPAGRMPTGEGGFVRSPVEPDLIRRLGELAGSCGGTLFDAVVAGTALLMQRYSGQDDVPLGTVWSARDTEGLADLIGFFPNTVVLRTDVSGEPSFRELLRRTAAANRADLANADLPFDALVQELAPARTPGSTPFFRVYVNIDEAAVALPEFAGLSAEAIPPDFSTARFELGFVLRPGAAEPEMDSVFSTELFDTGTVERMLAHLVRLWQEALAAPDRPVSELSMLTDAELTDAVWTWNDTGADLGADRCLHELFEEQADAAPDRTALVSGDTTLSYGELDRRANRLAHRLRDAGVSTGDLVGVCLHRGIDQPVAVLAVLKAGGAFVPLDPDYPAERLEFMCRDAGLWGVLTEPTLAGRVGDVWTVDVTEPDPDRSDRRPDAGVGPDDLAYVIYTSGSTGTPKGIGLRHAGAVNNFTDFNTRFALGTGEALLAVSSPSFDMSVYDLLGTVGCGGTVVLPTQDELRDPGAWARLIRAHGVTVWHSAPALLDLLLEHAERHRAELHSLRLALLGGDWIPVAQPDRLRAVAPGVRFIALGGATEASMDSIIFEVSEVDEGWASIPYGRPMANQRAYVLDRFDNPQPAGVPGELNLAGAGLARGYLGRPELTAEKFVERTLPGGRTERLYRTGDLARYRRDGVIELLGRLDFQVKIHGMRIEAGEIEAVLRGHPGVADAVVVAHGEPGHATLAGYVRTTGEPADGAGLRDWLGERLPRHMVPAVIETVEEFPTTPNGKVDRKALAARDLERAGGGEAPRDDLERRVAAAWSEVLSLPEVSIDDSFFQLGGDSFAAVRAMVALDNPVPVVELFKYPTVRGLAERLRAAGAGERELLHELTPAGRAADTTVVCLPYGGGNAIAYRPLAEALPERFRLLALHQPGYDPGGDPADFQPFDRIVDDAADEVLRRVDGPVIVYGHCAGTYMAAALARLLEARGADVRGLYLAAALPSDDPDGALAAERTTSDEEWAGYLTTIGGFDGALGWSTVEHMMTVGRHDHVGAMTFLRREAAGPPTSVRAHTVGFFGDADPATEHFAQRYVDWRRLVGDLDLAVVPGGGHYFVRDRADAVAARIDRDHPAEEATA
ncbi:non-ribosomal peptide synthetase [Amorphoplanes digitatis]|uniref:Amino acid adenylation domain-containing protein n=1 Tax=Actinoplanes digitatis TaxID=1868 RepID=A0A7W7MQ17_9ACTN|nr:non-ribosomal peptide synthetase [Actinoplanes digitatis]MBB4761974.1 amino acid adenylation domain-containing protein [Actinoplanes digitatis]